MASSLAFSISWPSARASAIAVRRRTGSSPAPARALAVADDDEAPGSKFAEQPATGSTA